MADTYFLIEYPIYRHFDADDVEVLAGICSDEKYRPGQVIFREGEPGDAMYIIKKGSVKVYKEAGARKKMITILSPGEFFGEMALIDGSERSATVSAEPDLGGETEVVKLSVQGYNKLKTEFAPTGFKVVEVLLKFLSQRVRRTTKKAAEIMKGRKRKKRGKSR